MKNLTINALTLTFIFQAGHAWAASPFETKYAALNCAQKMMIGYKGGDTGLQIATDYIEELLASQEDDAAVANIARACEGLSLRMKPNVQTQGALNRLALLQDRPARVVALVTKILMPRVTCHDLNLGFQGAVFEFIGIGAKVHGGLCQTENGAAWVQAGVGLGWGNGEGVGIYLDGHSPDASKPGERETFRVDSDYIKALVLGASGTAADKSLDSLRSARDLRRPEEIYDLNGISVGVGLVEVTYHNVSVPVLPLPGNKRLVVGLLRD